MQKKFAIISFVESIESVNFENNFTKKLPKFMKKMLILRNFPYTIEEIHLGGQVGVKVVVNVPFFIAQSDGSTVLEALASELYMLKVESIICDCDVSFPRYFHLSKGQNVLPILIEKIVEKTLRLSGAILKSAECVVIGGETDLTLTVLTVLTAIHKGINCLSLMTETPENTAFLKVSGDILEECGLVLSISKKNRSMLECADVIVNLSEQSMNIHHYLKKGAVYFDLSKNRENAVKMKIVRDDLHVFNDATINLFGDFLSLSELEALLYAKFRYMRAYVSHGFSKMLISDLVKAVYALDISVTELALLK